MPTDNDKTHEALVKSLDVSGWNLSQERQFIENLYVGRFNAFLLVFSLFLTAGFANSFSTLKSLVFFAGAGFLYLIWLPLYRAYKKHDLILAIIFQSKPEHPMAKLEEILKARGYRPRYRVSKHMGVTIPWICIGVLLIAGIVIQLGVLR